MLAVFLSATIAVGNLGYAAENVSNATQDLRAEFGVAHEAKVNGLERNDQVRIVVEFESAPVIEYAISKGVDLYDLEASFREEKEDDLLLEQKNTLQEIENMGIDMELHYEFVNVFNGFSATTTVANAKLIESLPNVKRVTISQVYYLEKPDMETSVDIIDAPETWALDFDGEGTVVAVLDSGIAPNHSDMQKIDRMARAEFPRKSVMDKLIKQENLPGQWFNDKVPYAYNYYDNNLHVTNIEDHGMHVAGTVGANGKLKGVAPQTQILGMKVFGDDPDFPSTYSDIYVRAIDDALKLHVDAINMSLGSTSSFLLDPSADPARQAIKNAQESGVVVAVSSGNSSRFGYGKKDPSPANPDFGVVGSPSLNPETLSVASIQNTHVMAQTIILGKDSLLEAGYQSSGTIDPVVTFENADIPYIFAGRGIEAGDLVDDPKTEINEAETDDFKDLDITGKIALIQRGGLNFSKKVLNAQERGAIGVIIFNSVAGGDEIMGMDFGTDAPNIKIPTVFMGITHGTMIKNYEGERVIKFTNEMMPVINVNKGKLAESSSWGPTPAMDFKPEITAPGGNIYSTLMNGGYGMMSGTSMASPHVAGGVALMAQKLEAEGFELSGMDKYNMIKNLLMCTAIPDVSKEPINAKYVLNTFTSPRRQGAGVMNLHAAATTPVIVYNSDTHLSKVPLGEIGNIATFKVTLESIANYDHETTYQISCPLGTDLVLNGAILNEPMPIAHADEVTPLVRFYEIVNGEEVEITKITMKSGDKKEIIVKMDITNAVTALGPTLENVFPNGGFVDGFLRFETSNAKEEDEVPSIGLPLFGFKGEWDKAPVLDGWRYDGAVPFYGDEVDNCFTYKALDKKFYRHGFTLVKDVEGKIKVVFNKEALAISNLPGVDKRTIQPSITFLRNADVFQINILDKDGNVLRKLAEERGLKKNYYDRGRSPNLSRTSDSWAWDGKINNKVVEGEYIYQIKTKIQGDGANWQVHEFPVMVDLTKPTVTATLKDKLLTAVGADNDGIFGYKAYVNGKEFESFDGLFDLTEEIKGATEIKLFAEDYAGLMSDVYVIRINDTEAPELQAGSKPVPLGYVTSNQVSFTGQFKDALGVQSVTVDGQEAKLTLVGGEEAQNQYPKVYNYEFTGYYPDGYHGAKIVATDLNGNIKEFERKFMVDSKAPEITILSGFETEIVANEVDQITLNALVEDNYTGFELKVNGDVVTNTQNDGVGIVPTTISYELKDYIVPLTVGLNFVEVEAVDGMGNKTVKAMKIFRRENVGTENPVVALTVAPDKYISYGKPAVIKAVSDSNVTWEVSILDSEGVKVQTYNHIGMTFEAVYAPAQEVKLNGDYEVVLKATKDGMPAQVLDLTVPQEPEEAIDLEAVEEAVNEVINEEVTVDVLDNEEAIVESTTNETVNEEVSIEVLETEAPVVAPSTVATAKFTVYNYPVKINEVKSLVSENGIVVSAKVEKLIDVQDDVMLIIQIKNEMGHVINITAAKARGTDFSTLIELSSGFGKPKAGSYKVDVFVWNGWDA